MTNKQVNLSCSCGTVKGQLTIDPKAMFHVHCLCCDCQQFAEHLGNADKILDQYGGTELLQTYPAYLQISKGLEQIDAVQLKEKGLFRWFTKCCHMPIANTMNSAKVPFVGVSVKLMEFDNSEQKESLLGPVTMKAFAKYARSSKPQDAHDRFPLSYMPKIIGFMLKGMIGKKHQPSPFFTQSKPIVDIKPIS